MSTIKKFTSFTTSNCYVVVPNDKEDVCFVFDLPPDVEPALEYIKSNNLSVGGYLLTHGHYDHALGVPKVDGNIYINMEDEFLARNPQEQLSQFKGFPSDASMEEKLKENLSTDPWNEACLKELCQFFLFFF